MVTHAFDLLSRGLELTKGKTFSDVGIEVKWMEAEGQMSERMDRDQKYGITHFPYDPSQELIAFAAGFLEHSEWPLSKALEKHGRMRAVAEYEVKNIKFIGNWLAFHRSATDLQMEHIYDDSESAHRLVVWA